MVDSSDISKSTIIMSDRGYEFYKVLAHIQQKKWKFLIRIKDFGIHNSRILHGFDLPNEDEFDVNMNINLTRKQTNEVKELLSVLFCCNKKEDTSCLPLTHTYYLLFSLLKTEET